MDYASQRMSEASGSSILPPLVTPPKITIRKKSFAPRTAHKKKIVLQFKTHAHPWGSREDLSDAYELPITQRENWWRTDIKVTPVPGTYETTDFIEELSKRPNTYNFKSESRTKARVHRSGLFLLPGAYEYHDFIEELSKKPATYMFKTGERFATDVLNFGLKDKYVNVPPNAYNTQKYLAIGGDKYTVKNYMFRSQTKRFPSQIFGLKEGPSPTTYKVKDFSITMPSVTSCFRSKTPRFYEPNPVNTDSL